MSNDMLPSVTSAACLQVFYGLVKTHLSATLYTTLLCLQSDSPVIGHFNCCHLHTVFPGDISAVVFDND